MLRDHADVPVELEHDRFVASPLTVANAPLDLEAYLASPDVIRTHSDGRWPTAGFTLEDDLELVARHQADHQDRRAFTFTLLAPSRDVATGCLYLNPLHDYLRRSGADAALLGEVPEAAAMVTFWLRQDQQDTGLADAVVDAVDGWLRDDWPLALHLFRLLPAETSSREALDRRGLQQTRLVLPDEPRPYLWYLGSR